MNDQPEQQPAEPANTHNSRRPRHVFKVTRRDMTGYPNAVEIELDAEYEWPMGKGRTFEQARWALIGDLCELIQIAVRLEEPTP